jgi:hypothetical protein
LLLLARVFIFNSPGANDKSSLEILNLILNLSKHINLRNFVSAPDEEFLDQAFYPFYWVLRDFALKLEEEQGRTITPAVFRARAARGRRLLRLRRAKEQHPPAHQDLIQGAPMLALLHAALGQVAATDALRAAAGPASPRVPGPSARLPPPDLLAAKRQEFSGPAHLRLEARHDAAQMDGVHQRRRGA